MIENPMSTAPKDGTPIELAVMTSTGISWLRGEHAFLKRGTWHPRWYRLEDMMEVSIKPHAWRRSTGFPETPSQDNQITETQPDLFA